MPCTPSVRGKMGSRRLQLLEEALAVGVFLVDKSGVGWCYMPIGKVLSEESKCCEHVIALSMEGTRLAALCATATFP